VLRTKNNKNNKLDNEYLIILNQIIFEFNKYNKSERETPSETSPSGGPKISEEPDLKCRENQNQIIHKNEE
jgi:hypothetical protein